MELLRTGEFILRFETTKIDASTPSLKDGLRQLWGTQQKLQIPRREAKLFEATFPQSNKEFKILHLNKNQYKLTVDGEHYLGHLYNLRTVVEAYAKCDNSKKGRVYNLGQAKRLFVIGDHKGRNYSKEALTPGHKINVNHVPMRPENVSNALITEAENDLVFATELLIKKRAELAEKKKTEKDATFKVAFERSSRVPVDEWMKSHEGTLTVTRGDEQFKTSVRLLAEKYPWQERLKNIAPFVKPTFVYRQDPPVVVQPKPQPAAVVVPSRKRAVVEEPEIFVVEDSQGKEHEFHSQQEADAFLKLN
jgi:hypothetical protein